MQGNIIIGRRLDGTGLEFEIVIDSTTTDDRRHKGDWDLTNTNAGCELVGFGGEEIITVIEAPTQAGITGLMVIHSRVDDPNFRVKSEQVPTDDVVPQINEAIMRLLHRESGSES